MELKDIQADPAKFQSLLYVPTGSGPRRFGQIMTPFQRERFSVVNPSLSSVARHAPPPRPRIWDERTKGSSKDTDWAVNLLWLLAFSRRCLRMQVGAYDQAQADELRLIVKGMLRLAAPLNRFLAEVVDVRENRIVNRRTDSRIEILTTDRLGSHGARPDVVLINELTHQKDRAFAETLLDNLDKMPNGFGVIATNAGHDPSWQLDWKRTFVESGRWTVLEYREPAPWIGAAALREAEKRNTPGRFRRLFLGEWPADTEGALDERDIAAAVTQTGPMLGDEEGYVFFGGLDVGIARHGSALVIVGLHVGKYEEHVRPRPVSDRLRMLIEAGLAEEPEPIVETSYEEPTGRVRLADVAVWKPRPGKRVSLEAVKNRILIAHRRYRMACLAVDPWQAEMLCEELGREGVPVARTPQTTASLQQQAAVLLEAFQQRTIDLYCEEDLLADLRRLQVKDTGLRLRLVSQQRIEGGPGTAHADAAAALSLALAVARTTNRLVLSREPGILIVG